MTTTDTDCIVVGGGLVGMLSARRLAQSGLSVRLLERGSLCREASWAGGGILSPLVPWQYPDAVSALVTVSQGCYPQLVAELLDETGIDAQWVRSGLLLLDFEAGPDIREWVRRHHVVLEVLDRDAVLAADGALASDVERALLLPDVAQVRNPRLGQALAGALPAQGVVVQEHCPVTSIRVQQGVVQGVDTPQGSYGAERVVVAGGAWSAGLLAGLDVDLPVSPVRGQMIQFETPPGLLRHIVLRDGYYLIPRRDGLVLAGSTLEHCGFNNDTTAAARELLHSRAGDIAPMLAGRPVVRHWAGLRPASPDGVPFIGELSEIKGLYLNTGHYRNGVVTAPASAQLLVDSMLGRTGVADMAPYQPPCAVPVLR